MSTMEGPRNERPATDPAGASRTEVGGPAAAQVYDGVGFRFVREALPELGPGEALVEVEMATVCGSDLHTLSGDRFTPVPTVLGHEAVGRVVALGEDFGSSQPAPGVAIGVGSRVTWTVAASCGNCDRCTCGLPQKCRSLLKVGHEARSEAWGLNGALATHVHLPAGTTLVPVPEEIPAAVVAPANCATATVTGAARRVGLEAGDRVVVIGCGLLGLTAVAYARRRGAASIVAVDPDASRRAAAMTFGADRVCTPGELPAVATARGASLVFELSGHPSGVEQAVAVAEVGARLALVGSVSEGSTSVILDPAVVVRRMLTIVGCHNYAARDLCEAVEFLAELAEEPQICEGLTGVVSPPFALAELDRALLAVRSGRWARVALKP